MSYNCKYKEYSRENFSNITTLLISLVLILLYLYINSFILCDEETLNNSEEELKELIKSDTITYLNLMYEYDELEREVDRLEEEAYNNLLNDKSATEKDWTKFENGLIGNEWIDALNKMEEKMDEAEVVYRRIFESEALIKEKEPDYSCQVTKCYYFETSDLSEQNPDGDI